ncbi:MAG TPA: copper amine oxidase N-terminal domain-containing protein [Bacillota bacterium]|nr:copper amine oxidase N-terminal domain-containing protein [Bacillota bacterium]HQE67094.1 copper amine oxidase N-terminal domain-containing protein [Bacillota bacterium]HQJ37483.1 copper amine oxidase N-terminal domain-containing protein [Bacillota bacterium]
MKKMLSIVITFALLFSMAAGFTTVVSAAEGGYAWVLVDTHEYPVPEADSFYGSLKGNTIELKYAWPYGLGVYASKDYDNPTNMHAIYTWSNPPSTIMPNETVTLKLEQNVISNRNGNYSIGFNPYFHMDMEGLDIGSATASKVIAKITYADGTAAKYPGIGYNQDAQAQQSFTADMTLNFIGEGRPGDKHALYMGVYAGSPGSVGVRYTYEWKQTSSANAAPISSGTTYLGTYSWAGEWDSNWGKMLITQNGASVTGTYTHDSGKINGTISGNVFTGTWSESPSYSPPSDAGDMELTMSADGKSFTGRWRYGSEGSWSNWDGSMRITEVIPAPKPAATSPAPVITTTQANSAGSNAETFESGSRIMWQPADGLGYRLFRSTSKSDLGISVTDFYITGTSYADVNIEANTTYYYTVKPVLAEAKPFEGIDEKLGAAIATYTVTTGSQVYKPGSFKHFIMLKLDNPNMSVDGVIQEVDPGRSTSPMTIAGRTMVPIRAVVEAMGGTIGWDQDTRKITLTARGNVVEMWLDKTDIKINGVSQKMDVAPVSKNGRTFVPVRFAAENLNCKVDWINSTKEAVIVYEE